MIHILTYQKHTDLINCLNYNQNLSKDRAIIVCYEQIKYGLGHMLVFQLISNHLGVSLCKFWTTRRFFINSY
jgi:hypothetical protein